MAAKKDNLKYRLMRVLSEHVGKHNAISMEELYRQVFGNKPYNKVNGTRKIRRLVELARRDGAPILSSMDNGLSGYYLASAGSEFEEYCRKIRNRALRILQIEAKLRKRSLPDIIREIEINMEA